MELPNEVVCAADGVKYAYRDTGGSDGVRLVLLQHFRGNLDNWGPALIDALASARRVVTFDNAGVGGSAGATPDTFEQMARDAISFLAALEVDHADLLGFSIGSRRHRRIPRRQLNRLGAASFADRSARDLHRRGRVGHRHCRLVHNRLSRDHRRN